MRSVTCMQLGLRRWSGLLRCWRSSSVSLGKCQFLSLLFCLLGELTAWSKTILLALLGSHEPTPPNLNPKAFYLLVDCHKPKVTSGSVFELANPDSDSFLLHLYTLHMWWLHEMLNIVSCRSTPETKNAAVFILLPPSPSPFVCDYKMLMSRFSLERAKLFGLGKTEVT